MRTIIALAAVALVGLSQQAAAQQADALELISMCEERLAEHQDVTEIADSLLALSGLELKPEDRFRGMDCLKEHFGERYFFANDTGSFISETDERSQLTEANRETREAERLQEERIAAAAKVRRANEYEYTERLVDACYRTLEDDPLTALTVLECREIFILRGFDR